MEPDGGFKRGDTEFIQRSFHNRDGPGAGQIERNQFGNQRVVINRQFVALVQVGVQSHPISARRQIFIDGSRAGKKVTIGVFGINPALDGTAAKVQVVKTIAELLTGGQSDLLFDQINAGGQLGDRVLHLDTGVYFHEIKVPIGIQKKFNRAGIAVINRFGSYYGGRAHGLPQFVGQSGGRGFFDEFLKTSLDGAFPLPYMGRVAGLIR